MKKRLLILSFFVLFMLGTYAVSSRFFQLGLKNQIKISEFVSTPEPTVSVGIPLTISIPKLHINATIEKVGLDKENRMGIPTNPLNAGWYELGSRPGEAGSAVIAGHLDLPGGAPSIFYNLSSLLPGDEISIDDEFQKHYIFRVQTISKYLDSSFPIEKVFGQTNEKRLNLITCNGVFDRSSKNYSNRLVVYSVLENK